MKCYFLRLAFFLLLFSGCANLRENLTEVPRVVWGSSTKALEKARPSATAQIYQTNPRECFDKILSIAQKEEMKVFIKNRRKELIVLMGIKGSVVTTEVGIFISQLETTKTKVEIVSLSPQAQETASHIIFSGLTQAFSETKQ